MRGYIKYTILLCRKTKIFYGIYLEIQKNKLIKKKYYE